ncbi:hypothetical protein JOM56_010224 [Amanita muscaria]
MPTFQGNTSPAQRSASKPQIRPFINQYHIDLSEFDPDVHGSFNDFFVRKCRPARDHLPIQITKLSLPSASSQSGSELEAAQLAHISVYCVTPQDYHSPISGTVIIPVNHYGVDPLAINYSVSVLYSNACTVIVTSTEKFGQVLSVAIGASEVGSVDVSEARGLLRKGDEVGNFMYGGSTFLIP